MPAAKLANLVLANLHSFRKSLSMPETAALSADGTHVYFPPWAERSGLVHGTTTRAALPHPGKDALLTAVPNARAAGAIPVLPTLGADQVHGARIGVLDTALGEWTRPEGFRWDADGQIGEFPATDALVTNQRGVLLAIQTADCLPVFLIDTEAGVIGLAHCGWRGLDAGLAGAMVHSMCGCGAEPARIEAWLGPCIQAGSYEVGSDLIERFGSSFPGACITPDGRHLDLPAIALWQIKQAGVPAGAIQSSQECTLSQTQRYHSFRAEGERSGRLLSFLALV